MKHKEIPTRNTYMTDCFRKVKNPETGKVEVKRWVQDNQVSVTLSTHDGNVFYKGARIA